MKVFVLAADPTGFSGNLYWLGVASSRKNAFLLCEEWLIKDLEVEELIPDNASEEFFQKLAEEYGYYIQCYEHEVDVLKC